MNDELINEDGIETKQNGVNKKKCFVILAISFILIICLVIFLIFILREKEENCEPGYFPIKGECKPYSFVVTYHKYIIVDKIKLINETYLDYIGEMYMNNEIFNKVSSYNFSSNGNYTIYFDMDISSLESLENMFDGVINQIFT